MTSDEVIDLVHKIDVLQAQRDEMDSRIIALKKLLDAAVGGRRIIAARPDSAVSNRRSRESPRMSAAVRHIQDNPRADYRSLARAVYGDITTTNIKKTRTLVFHMKNAEMISGTPGAWKAALPKPAPEPDIEDGDNANAFPALL